MADQSIGTARIDVVVKTDTMQPGLEAAKRAVSGFGTEAEAQFNKADAASKKYAASLIRQTDLMGKTRAEQIAYNAQTKIGGDLGEQIAKKALAQEAAFKGAASGAKALGDELNSSSFSGAQLFKVNQLLSDFKKRASEAAVSAAGGIGESDSQQAERIAAMVKATAGEQIAANAAAAASNVELTASTEARAAAEVIANAESVAAINAATMAKTESYARLQVAMAGNLATEAGMVEAELALDAAMATNAISANEQSAYFVKLAAAESVATGTTEANTVANLENAASFKLNSRATAELGVLFGELASGNTGRLKQSVAALANQTGLLGKLISPVGLAVTGAAAAIGLFVAAAVKGEQETTAYNKALVTTGDYAGVTAGRLKDLAESMTTASTTQHAAAAALAEVASSGKFTAQQIGLVGKAALAMAETTGQATSETIKQFEAIGQKPVEAILKLNDAQHFLTSSTYEQIKALEDQGKTQEAATLAMQTYSASLDDRRKEVVSNAGSMERAWDSVASHAKGAWDAMLDIGRTQSIGDKARGLQEQIGKLKGGRFLPNGIFEEGLSESAPQIQAMRKQISDLYTQAQDENKKAADKSAAAQLVQMEANSDRQAPQYATNEKKRVKAYLAAKDEGDKAIDAAVLAGNATLADKLRKNEAQTLAGINDQYANKVGRTRSTRRAEGPGDPSDMVNIRKQITDAINKETDASVTQMAQEAKAKVQSMEYQSVLEEKLKTYREEAQLQAESIGMGQHEIELRRQIIDVEKEADNELAKLNREKNTTPGYTEEQYRDDVSKLKAYEAERIRIVTDTESEVNKARSSFGNGASSALKDFEYSAGDVAGQTHDLFTNAFDGMSDALANFATTGKLNFKGLVTSILSDLAKMEARIIASKILQSIIGAFAGGYGGTNGNGGVDTNSQGFVSHVYANGGVVDGSRNLSAYSGSVVDRPTTFAFAKGNGLMGEAGPEAIMPLKRGPDGKLGIAGGGGGSSISLSQTFVVDGKGGSDQTSGSNDDALRQFAGKMKSVAQQTIMDEQRPGGSLWRMAHA